MTLVFAHRGTSSIALENSPSSFKKAIEIKADYIETDIRKTKDEKIIIMHDKDIKRTTNGKGKISNMKLAEIKRFKLKNGEEILTLEELIDMVKNKIKLNIEIKYTQDASTAKKVVSLLRRKGILKDVMISSFSVKILKTIREISPNIETALLYTDDKTPRVIVKRLYYSSRIVKKAKILKTDHLNLHYRFITKRLLKKAFENNLKVNVWTVNSDKLLDKMKNLGVDGIITDYPQKLCNLKAGKSN